MNQIKKKSTNMLEHVESLPEYKTANKIIEK